jgi:peptide/nickel transport system permease protein
VGALLRHAGVLVVVVCVAVSALVTVVPLQPRSGAPNLSARLQPPSWLGGRGDFLLGSDQLGREVLYRLLGGLRTSLVIGAVAATAAAVLGVAVGLTSGYAGGWVDTLLMRLVDTQLSFPFLVLAIAIVSVLGHSLVNVLMILILWGWATFARFARGEALALRESDFVQASYALGAGSGRILRRHLLPNVLPRLAVVWTYMVAQMAVGEGSLSFLGLGVEEPAVSLATMMNDGRVHLSTAWWVATFPGIALMLLILGVNAMGDSLADRFNPRLGRGGLRLV